MESLSVVRLEESLKDLKRVYGGDGIVLESTFSMVGDKRGSLKELLAEIEGELQHIGGGTT